MPRYKAICDYLGTQFAGWQVQADASTVQGEIQNALSTYFRENISIYGCGRTDAGVHAEDFVFHVDMHAAAGNSDLKGLNALLHPDIAIKEISEVKDDFHARFSCLKRTYHYRIHGIKNPFISAVSLAYPYFSQLDPELLNERSQWLLGNHDFKTFCKSNSGNDHFRCEIFEAQWLRRGPELIFKISGNRFLRGMVRLIVGMALRVNEGQMTLEEVKDQFHNQKPLSKPWSAPARGLTLVGLEYPEMV